MQIQPWSTDIDLHDNSLRVGGSAELLRRLAESLGFPGYEPLMEMNGLTFDVVMFQEINQVKHLKSK